MALHYKSCGLTNVWLKSGYKAHETNYGTSYSYEDIDGLYCAIAMQLCIGQQEIKAEALRFLRKRLGYSQDELGTELGYTSQAIAKWEKGTSKIPVAIARLVRLLCIYKFFPNKLLRDAFEAIHTPPIDRLEFEYINSMWKVVGARVVMHDAQISTPKCITDNIYSVGFVKHYLPQAVYVKQAPINKLMRDEISILQGTRNISAYRMMSTIEAGDLDIYKIQDDNLILNTESASATTSRQFKLNADSITQGTC